MPNKVNHSMRGLLILALVSITLSYTPFALAELSTLFTTPEERQIINANRYKIQGEIEEAPVVADEPDLPIQPFFMEEVSRQYRVSGITISADGDHRAWINGAVYQDGEMIDEESRVKILAGDQVRVRITAPDDEHYFATSGETVDVLFMAPMEN